MLRYLANRLKAGMGRMRRSESGASAVEFALVAGPFFYVLGCICETGLILFTEYVIQNSVQEAGRLVRTGQAASSAGTPIMTADQFKAAICDRVGAIIDCDGKVSVYVNNATSFASLSTTVPDPLTIGKKADGTPYTVVYSPGKTLEAATVIATYDWYFALPFLNFLGNFDSDKARRIYGLAIFRNEP